MSSPTADYYKQRFYQAANKAGQAASNARQFVSGAANAFTNPVPFAPIAPVNRFASSGNNSSGSGVASDGEYKMFTRAQLNDLYGNKSGNRGSSFMNTNFFSLGEGPIEHIIMMFQLYIALIAALSRLSMNAASMSASFLFGNETLINIFSIFLENALNLILNRNVADMSLDQLHQSLEMNKPKLQQMSALLINEISALALGLSDVCSKIATDWITNVLPGLLKSSAIGASSAAEAGINAATMGAFGELVEIFSAGAAAVGGMMKIMNGLQNNIGNFKEAYGKVSNAYDGLVKLKELFSKSPSEIAAAATAAVIPQTVQKIADRAVDAITSAGNPYLSPGAAPNPAALDATPGAPFKSLIGNAADKGVNYLANAGLDAANRLSTNLVNKGVDLGLKGLRGVAKAIKGEAAIPQPQSPPPSESSIRNLANKIKENFGTVKEMARKFGITVTGLSGLADKIRTNSQLAAYLAKRLGMTITGLQGSMLTRLADELEGMSGDPENASVRRAKSIGQQVVRPVANGLNNVSNYLDRVSGGGSNGGSNGRDKNKMKSRKYLKNKKYFKKYMSTLRRKTSKKELDLLNGIRDLKTMISL
uniref:Uncharacterized protein n=1 Tax=viral metagenome TaxID=1070528 RepID=A0A6C0I3E2_9ZZZZ